MNPLETGLFVNQEEFIILILELIYKIIMHACTIFVVIQVPPESVHIFLRLK